MFMGWGKRWGGDLYNLIWSKHTSRLKSSLKWSMLPDLPSESSRLFVEKLFLKGPKLNSHSSIAIFYIPLRVLLVCLFWCHQLLRLKLTRIPATFPRKGPSSERLARSLPSWGAGPPLLREGGGQGSEKEANSMPKAYMWLGEIFSFLSSSEILTGITSQDSKCFLSCHNPLKFFLPHSPVILSVFLTHSPRGLVPLLHPASLTQAPGKGPRRLSSLWAIIGECREVFAMAAELISYLNTEDSGASVCRYLNVTAYFNCKGKRKSVLWITGQYFEPPKPPSLPPQKIHKINHQSTPIKKERGEKTLKRKFFAQWTKLKAR